MGITQRQEKILNTLIQEYIKTAKPVGSEFLVEKHNFGICPATIRNEMQRLTEMGYLLQPHTSAGRIPTNKAYRFFVDSFLGSDFEEDLFFNKFTEISDKAENIFKFTELVAKKIALASSNLALVYLFDEDFIWKDGWGEVFQNPEFKERYFIEEFIKTVESFEKNIKDFIGQEKKLSEPKVFIGKEKSILDSKDFSLIVSRTNFPQNEKGLLAILGPKRMAYDKNIGLISSLVKELKNF